MLKQDYILENFWFDNSLFHLKALFSYLLYVLFFVSSVWCWELQGDKMKKDTCSLVQIVYVHAYLQIEVVWSSVYVLYKMFLIYVHVYIYTEYININIYIYKNIKIIITEEKSYSSSIVFPQRIDRYPQDSILRNLFAFFAKERPLWVLQRQPNTLLVSSQGI